MRFAAHTGLAFSLMLLPCAVPLACHVGLLPSSLGDELLAVTISGAAVGSMRLLQRLCDG